MPNDLGTLISLAELGISVAGVLITIWLALIVNRSAARITQLEFARSIQDSWIHVDDVTLRDPALIKLSERFHPPHETSDPNFPLKRHFLFIYLSPLNTTYQAARQGLFGKAGAQSIADIKEQLKFVVRDDDAYWLTQHQSFDPDFKALCHEARLAVTAAPRP